MDTLPQVVDEQPTGWRKSTDVGFKAVVLLPGERVRVLMSFQTHTGIHLYRCHILEHEDMGMMRHFLIEA